MITGMADREEAENLRHLPSGISSLSWNWKNLFNVVEHSLDQQPSAPVLRQSNRSDHRYDLHVYCISSTWYRSQCISADLYRLILVCLNAFDLTLTLSGIAGIILSIGMAVDANVIIYARIRERDCRWQDSKSSY